MKKLKKIIKQKNLNPMNNRKKVGIILFATSIGLFFLFAIRLTYIVTVGKVAGVSLAEKTKDLYTYTSTVKGKRGSILDRNGEVIAEDATSYSIYAVVSTDYKGVGDKELYAKEENYEQIAEILAEHTKIDKADALTKLKDNKNEDGSDKFQVEFGLGGQNISLETKQEIEKVMKEKNLYGIYFTGHPARIYPNGIFSSHFIGYAALEDAEDESKGLIGKMGLEEAYDDVLSGTDGKIEYEQDINGNPVPGTVTTEKEAVDGKDIYTTLDIRFQTHLESLMDKVNEEYQPEKLTAMLVEAKTGNIVSMAQRPTFNPETKEGLGEGGTWENYLITKFEPGSTMKPFVVAAAMQEGKFNPDATFVYPSDGTNIGYKIGDIHVNDHDNGAIGTLTFRQALSWSSNVGMLTLEQSIGGNVWKDYLKKFGFGQSTNSGLIGEASGEIPGDNLVDVAVSSFGQAITVTNFQMIQAYTAIANEGTMLKPQFISKIVDSNTNEEEVYGPETVGDQIITSEQASAIRSYLVDTVEDEKYGVAHGVYSVPGYHIAAKTGTAEINDAVTGYKEGETAYTYSVMEMVPAEDPEYLLYITMREPKNTNTRTSLAIIANDLLKVVLGASNNINES